MKRARGNGGARTALQPEGILVLGHQDNDPVVAAGLGLPSPRKGELISARVVPATPDSSRAAVCIGDDLWALAEAADPVTAAPTIPRKPRLS